MRDFCLNLVKTTTEYREKNNIVKKDLIQYLIQLRNNNTETGPDGDEWKINATTGIKINIKNKTINEYYIQGRLCNGSVLIQITNIFYSPILPILIE